MPRKAKEIAPVLDKLAWIEKQLRQAIDEDARLSQIIEAGPQPKSTATGFSQLDPRTCTCGARAERIKDHSPECGIKVVTDLTPILAAMKESRLNRAQVAHLLSLRDEIQPADDPEGLDEVISYVDQLIADNQRLTEENKRLHRTVARMSVELEIPEAEVIG